MPQMQRPNSMLSVMKNQKIQRYKDYRNGALLKERLGMSARQGRIEDSTTSYNENRFVRET